MNERILIVDDDASICETFEHHLGRRGYHVSTTQSAEDALALIPAIQPALVITDIRMPGTDGIELLQRIKSANRDTVVLMITAHEDMTSAVSAMKAGAYDYLVKPLDLDQIDILVERCLSERTMRHRVQHLSTQASLGHELTQLVGRAPAMIEIYKMIGVLVQNRATVLIRGETGTGKEVIARAIHFNSPDAQEPFVAVNCTALTTTLLESELFGHVRGAFTGAVESRKGYFELAGAGTVFLDEIGDMDLELQGKVLRVVEQSDFYPVGAERPRPTRARVIAATHRPLEELIQKGAFREDLYFRLKVVQLVVPPLRDRKGDIPLLAEHLIGKIARKLHKRIDGIADEAMKALQDYDWPGNVRELENALTRAAVLARGSVIGRDRIALDSAVIREDFEGQKASVDESLDAMEAAHVRRMLDQTGGNKRQAARRLRISRPRLDRLIEKYRINT